MTDTAASSILDASALLAYLHGEPGDQVVEATLAARAFISAVNYAEALTRLVQGPNTAQTVDRLLRDRGVIGGLLTVETMTEGDAVVVADLRASTRALGLSLGDRVCLATALRLGLPVVTADRDWANLSLAVPVRLIRP